MSDDYQKYIKELHTEGNRVSEYQEQKRKRTAADVLVGSGKRWGEEVSEGDAQYRRVAENAAPFSLPRGLS